MEYRDDTPAWDQLPGEPDLWHGRFRDHYLPASPERSIEKAFLAAQEGGAGAARGGESAARGNARGHQKRPSRHWYSTARDWKWSDRARAYDAQKRRDAQKANAASVERMQKTHSVLLQDATNKLIRVAPVVRWDNLSPLTYMRLLRETIHLQRLVMGQPVTVEEIRHRTTSVGDATSEETQAAVNAARFQATPEMYSEVLKVLAAHENKPEESDDGGFQDHAGAQGPDGPDGVGTGP
jgi:hypothetical protein